MSMFRNTYDVPAENDVSGSTQGILSDLPDFQNYGAAETFIRMTRLERALSVLKGKPPRFYVGALASVALVLSLTALMYFWVVNYSTDPGANGGKSTKEELFGSSSIPLSQLKQVESPIPVITSSSFTGTGVGKEINDMDPNSDRKNPALLAAATPTDLSKISENDDHAANVTFDLTFYLRKTRAAHIVRSEMRLPNGTRVPCVNETTTIFPDYRSYIVQTFRDESNVCPNCTFPKSLKLKPGQTLANKNRISLLMEMEKQNVTFDIQHCTERRKGVQFQSFVGYVILARRCNKAVGPAYGKKKREVMLRLANLACDQLYNYPVNRTVFSGNNPLEMQQHELHCLENLADLEMKYVSGSDATNSTQTSVTSPVQVTGSAQNATISQIVQ